MNSPLSPKVVAAAIAGFIIMALTGAVSLLEPSAFDALGMWGPVVFTGVTTAAAAVAGWWKTDPLRVRALQSGMTRIEDDVYLKDLEEFEPVPVVVVDDFSPEEKEKNPEAPPSGTIG